MKMKLFRPGIIFFCLLLLVPAMAISQEQGKENQSTPPATHEKTDHEAGLSKDTKLQDSQRKKDPEWPRPFQPSEKVGADSVISFPVDI